MTHRVSGCVSNRSQAIQSSVTNAVNAKAMALSRQGKDIINLSLGEPDFDTPDFIKAAAIQAIKDGLTKYTDVEGTPELRAAIIQKLQRDNQLDYTPAEIVVSAGVKQGLYHLLQGLLNPGDEVIIPAPYWVSYPAMVQLAEATPVIIAADQKQNFKITAAQLEAAITPKTKCFILNSPSNPTGKLYTAAELKALAAVLLKHPQIVIASDDMYEYIVWSQHPFVNILNVCPALADQTVVFNGVSKAYAMTGWRIGYAAGPLYLMQVMKKIQSQSAGNPNSIAQAAAITALQADRSALRYMYTAFQQRHDQLLADLHKINGFDTSPADGTFYLFPAVHTAIKKLKLPDDVAFANFLLEKAGVATVPGTGFGMPGHIRLSYAVSTARLEAATARIAIALS